MGFFAIFGEGKVRVRNVVFVTAFAMLAMVMPADVQAMRVDMDMLAAGFRMPGGALWLIGPMLLAVAGAITLGWRRAAAGGRGDLRSNR